MSHVARESHQQRRRALAIVIGAVLASSAAKAEQAAAPGLVEEVIVLGRGETRQVQSISASQIDALPAGTSPLKAIEKLPGVNFQSADPYGAYEWSTRITVRGFNQNQLGFTLDGVPLGDMTYGNHNGLHISRAIPSEAVTRVTLSQGAGALDTASSSNLGGAIEFFSIDPASEFGVRAEQMFGSDSARRTYAQLDSGEFGAGTRLFVAAMDASTDKWKGGGDQQQRMYTFKAVQPIGEGELTAYYNYSDRAEIDYQDLSYAIIERRGWEWDNWYPNWGAAVSAAQACAASNFSDGEVCDDAYWNASGLRKDDLGYLALDLPIGESLSLNVTGYLHQNEGQGLWGSPYVPTPGGAPLTIRTTEYDVDRTGAIASITWSLGAHELNAGVWVENNEFNQARRFYGEPNIDAPTRSFEDFQRNPLLTQWEYAFETDTLVFHVQDAWQVSDSVRVVAGFRSLKVENSADTIVGPVKTGDIEAEESFLPQVGVNWELNEQHEMFASIAQNASAFQASGTSGPFSATAAGFAAIRDVIEPETSTNYEVGWRFRGNTIDGLLAAYHVDFEDRLLTIAQGTSIQGFENVLANVGSVTTNGVEAALSWRPVNHLTWFNSFTWNESEYEDDYLDGTTLVQVSGNQVVNAPEILLRSELGYDNGALFARIDANYTDERYYSYLNDASVDSYTLLNAGVGYRFRNLGVVDELIVQADVTNLTDKEYISTVGSGGFRASDAAGTQQTLLRGAPRQFFVSAKAKF